MKKARALRVFLVVRRSRRRGVVAGIKGRYEVSGVGAGVGRLLG